MMTPLRRYVLSNFIRHLLISHIFTFIFMMGLFHLHRRTSVYFVVIAAAFISVSSFIYLMITTDALTNAIVKPIKELANALKIKSAAYDDMPKLPEPKTLEI